MPVKKQTAKEYFTQLAIIHGALFGFQIMFAAIAFYWVHNGQAGTDKDMVSTFTYAAIGLGVAGTFGGALINKKQLESIRLMPELKNKLKAYKGALLLKWALLEVPCLFCLICFFLSGNNLFLTLAMVEMLAFFMMRPSVATTGVDLQLSPQEKSFIENPSSVITEIELSTTEE